MNNHSFHIAILSCCIDDWGGSEELWARSIPLLINENCSFTLYKNRINFQHPEIKKLQALGVRFSELDPQRSVVARTVRKAQQITNRITGSHYRNPLTFSDLPAVFHQQLRNYRPDFVIIAQGINFDGLEFAYECRELQIPYAIIAQKGVDFYWPPTRYREEMRKTLQAARRCYFVSKHNQTLTEEQLGLRLENTELVFNPVKLPRTPLPFPSAANGYKLACVARLFIIDKGQDILLRILSKEPWKSRNITVSFIGSGTDELGLKELARLLNVNNVTFPGQLNNISEVWQSHHALLLPSRSEGMALSVLEAMASGRPVIVTNAGGHAEIIQQGSNGFISDATETAFAANMEAAWQQREHWEQIGLQATRYIKEYVPPSPEHNFSLSILKLLNEL